jgi:hypothetical protein
MYVDSGGKYVKTFLLDTKHNTGSCLLAKVSLPTNAKSRGHCITSIMFFQHQSRQINVWWLFPKDVRPFFFLRETNNKDSIIRDIYTKHYFCAAQCCTTVSGQIRINSNCVGHCCMVVWHLKRLKIINCNHLSMTRAKIVYIFIQVCLKTDYLMDNYHFIISQYYADWPFCASLCLTKLFCDWAWLSKTQKSTVAGWKDAQI